MMTLMILMPTMTASTRRIIIMVIIAAGQEPWVLDFPLPDQPDSIDHGPADGFNFGGGLGFVYEAMGVHSAVINGKTQSEDVDRYEQVSMNVLHCKGKKFIQACQKRQRL